MAKKEMTVVPEIIDSVEALETKMAAMREAQKVFATYTQEQVDKIFHAAAIAANQMRIPLAKMAVEETGMGVVEDKVIKNNYAAEHIHNAYKDMKTCGVIEEDKAYGIKKIAEPIGLVAAVIPTTNPTSTAIFKTLICLKTRNAIIISPHPRAKACTIAAAKVVLDAAVKAGAPEGIIGWIDVPSLELTNTVMKDADIILATGGPGMVKAAYSSGKPLPLCQKESWLMFCHRRHRMLTMVWPCPASGRLNIWKRRERTHDETEDSENDCGSLHRGGCRLSGTWPAQRTKAEWGSGPGNSAAAPHPDTFKRHRRQCGGELRVHCQAGGAEAGQGSRRRHGSHP